MIPCNRVREMRLKKGLSGLECSRRAKIAPGILSNIETMKIIVYPGWRRRLSRVLDVPENLLFPEDVSEGGNDSLISQKDTEEVRRGTERG